MGAYRVVTEVMGKYDNFKTSCEKRYFVLQSPFTPMLPGAYKV